MNLIGLIDTTAQALNIVRKNSQPADRTANTFIKSKRSLGSNDRRFIADLLFFTLRNLTYVEHLSQESIRLLYEKHNTKPDISKNELLNSKVDDFMLVLSSLVLFESDSSERSHTLEKFLNPKELSNSESITTIISSHPTQYLFSTSDDINNWIKILYYYIELILNSSEEEQQSNLEFSLNNYKYSLIRYSMPEWLVNNLLTYSNLKIKEIFELANAFTKSAPVTLRINDRLHERSEILNELSKMDIDFSPCSLSPSAVNISKRIYLIDNPIYKKGMIEVQDEASQMVAYALAPDPDWIVLDACAGAGGKALHIASLQEDSGLVIATDTEFKRLKEIEPRAANASLSSIHYYSIGSDGLPKCNDRNIKYFKRKSFDAVLVDAPCSGMGTLRREPMKKFRTSERLIQKLSDKQFEILDWYSQFLNIGGTLIYATCSIMPQENDLVVERFLDENKNFEPDSLAEAFAKFGIQVPNLGPDEYKMTFYPHIYGTDGFFIARFKRI